MANEFSAVVGLANSGKRFPVMKLAKDQPGLAAVISKLVSPEITPSYGNDGNRKPEIPNTMQFMATSQKVGANIADAKTVMQLLPDMELSAQILISSVLSPKDMTTTELSYTPPEDLLDAELSASLISRLRAHFEQDYKIKPLLPKILRDMLFETGSYAVAVIPENSLDEIINTDSRITMESVADYFDQNGTARSIGLLGAAVKKKEEPKRPGLSLESITNYKIDNTVGQQITFESQLGQAYDDSFITVIDNPSILKVPALNQRIREARVMDALGVRAMESYAHKLTDRQMTGLIYKTREYGYRPVASLKTQEQLKRRTIGNPLIAHFPSESVITVHVPSSPEVHIGYFVMVDADGYPVSANGNRDEYAQMGMRLSGANGGTGGGFASSMLAKVQNGMDGFTMPGQSGVDQSKRMFANMVEADLLARLRNGIYGNGVALASNSELYHIMLARSLAKQHTQMLFIPVELMTYFAFRYDENGIGESLLDGMKILNSLRAMLMFSDVMAAVRNSIGRTEVKLKLDENDPDPKKAIEIMKHEIINSRKQAFPLGANSPTDLVDYLTKAGYEFTYEGHPGLPDISVDFSEKNTNYVKPDQDLAEYLRKAAIMSVGLSPENVDAGFQAEFATSIMTNNLLLTKRVMNIQEAFTPQLADHLRKVAMNSEGLCTDLIQIIADNFDKLDVEEIVQEGEITDQQRASSKQYICNKVLQDFLLNFEVSLPQPNSVTLENQATAMDTYSKAVDAGLDYWINDSFFTSDVVGDAANQVGVVRAIVKAQLMRNWMSENGVMPELAELTTLGEDGQPAFDFRGAFATHIAALGKGIGDLLVGLKPVKVALDTEIQGLGEDLQGGGGGSDTGGEEDNAGGGDDDMFGDDGKDPFGAAPVEEEEEEAPDEAGGQSLNGEAEKPEKEEAETKDDEAEKPAE